MALEEKTVTIPMRFGQDEGTDNGSDLTGLMAIENGIYDKEGALRPRFGFVIEESLSDEPRGLVLAGKTLGVVTRDEILNYDPYLQGTTSGSPDTEENVGASPSALSRAITTFYGGRSVRGVDIAVQAPDASGMQYVAVISSEEEDGTDSQLWFRLFNYRTGTLLLAHRHTDAAKVFGVRVLPVGTALNFMFIAHIEDGSAVKKIISQRLVPGSGSFGSVNTITSDPASTLSLPVFDASYDSSLDVFFVGYAKSSVAEFVVAKCSSTTGAVTATSSAATIGSHQTSQAVGIALMGSWVVAGYSAASDQDLVFQSFNRSTLALGDDLDTGLDGGTIIRSVGFSTPEFNGLGYVFNLIASRDIAEKSIYLQEYELTESTGVFFAGGIGALREIENLRIVSRPFRLSGDGDDMVLVTHAASEEHSYLGVYAMRLDTTQIVAALGVDEARPYRSDVSPSQLESLVTVNTVSTDVFATALPVALESAAADDIADGIMLHYRARIIELDFDQRVTYATRIEDVTYLAGAMVREFDGRRGQEGTMMSAPPAPTVTANVGGAMVAGTYFYATVVQQSDRFGNIRVSPPSVVSAVVLGAAGTVNVFAYNRILPVADLVTGGDDARAILVYRTEADGSVFHLVATGIESDLFTFIDSTTDAELTLADSLDVSGQTELLSEPLPAMRSMWAHGNRLFGIMAETPRVLRYSQSMEQPSAPSWNFALSKTIETSGGDLVAGGSLPGKCVLFQENQILVMGGRGPSNAGPDAGGDGFDDPEPISNGIGIHPSDPGCVVHFPGGILFRSKTGFHVLANDCSVTYVGQGVQDRVASMGLTSMAAYLPSHHQIWIASNDSPQILVYDTRFGRWSTFSGLWTPDSDSPAGVQEIDGVVYLLMRSPGGGGYLYKYRVETDTDGTGFVPDQVIDTPWFKGPGDGSTFRVWSVIVTVRVHGDIEYPDMDATPGVTLATYTVSHNDPTKDQEVADGSREYVFPEGDKAGIKQLRIRPNKQRCEAFRCRISVTGTSTPVSVVSVKYVYGVESEASKTPRRA